MVSNECDCG